MQMFGFPRRVVQAATLGLGMKLVEVYCSFQRRQITFVYSADDRIDFRELVRGLARRFGGRIEMRQISMREEASRLGGIDTCGLVLCCSSFMRDIRLVTSNRLGRLGCRWRIPACSAGAAVRGVVFCSKPWTCKVHRPVGT